MPNNSKKYMKEYYENNKDKYKGKYNAVVHCDVCDIDITKLNFSKHKKTNKHKANEERKDNVVISKKMYDDIMKVAEKMKLVTSK